MQITKELLEKIYQKAYEESVKISSNSDHANWYPCGSNHLFAKGNSKLANAIRKHKPSGWRIMNANPGVWISVSFPMRDAFESQSMNYSRPCYDTLARLLRDAGIDDVSVDGYID